MSARKTKRPSLALGSLGESFDDDSNAGRRGPDDIPEIPPDVGDNRLLFVNCHEGHVGKFKSNHISTTKYNVINFLPKQLYEQFRRLANAYFLLIILIQFIPNLTPLNPFASIFPLALVLFISAVKEFVEDMRRRKQDRQINNRSAHVIKDGRVEHVTWNNVRVGDLCLVRNTEPFPADLVAIDSSEPQGVCYIETMNLDGETNLKFRQVKHMKTKASKLEHEALENSNIRAAVICESPNSMLYNFEGTVIRNGRPLAVGLRQFLLRGASLRNTEWIVGIAVYTGHDSKLMQNAMSPPSKRSQVDRVMNSFVALIFVFQLIVCLCAGLGFFLESEKNIGNASYLGSLTQGPILQSSLFTFLTFLILLNVMIPISLYVSTEMVRVAQGYFMQMDEEMYHAETNTRCKARTSNLNEELGQVEYVFSDKTGTLTQNKMEFLKCSVGGVAYGHAVTEAQRGQAVREGRPIDEEHAHVKVSKDDRFFFDDPLIFEHLESGAKNAHLIDLFLTMMAVCHTAMPRLAPGADVSTVEYQASSPDEGALVDAARGLGYMFYERDPDAVTVAVEDEDRRYEVLNVLEFTSARKRMSVIVRDPAGRIVIYTKGADSIVYDRLAPDKSQRDLARRTRRHLQRFASDGLRTLVFAYAPLDPEVYEDWDERYKAAQTQVSGRDEAVAEVADEIERNLFLVGASAIEDKLQEGVPQAIREILAANIKLWVLTGDKLETAINIGFSCSILHEAMTLLVISGPDIDHIEQQIDDAINDYNPLVFTDGELGLVIEGSSLEHALARDDVALKFLRLGMFCKSVVCCRVSPLQKAKVVLLVKNNLNAVTLAIGDGANDVSMIQAAHLGIGISGNEGMQAVMASDYAIAQFRFLKRLLLVHGRWNYKRLSKLILYSFYKNMAFAMPQFWYSWYNSFSGQTLYESLLVPLFNVFFAGLPVIVLTSLDQDVSARNSLRFPTLYEAGQKKVDFNKMLFITWIMSGIIHSSVVFFIVLFTADPTMSVYEFGSVIYTAVVLVVNGRLAMEINYLTWLHVAAILSSVLAFFALLFLSSIVPGSLPHMYHVAHSLYVSPRYWLIVIIATAAALLPEIAYKYIRRTYSPRLYHVIRWLHHKGIDMDNYAQDVADAVNATRLGLSERELADMIDPEQQHTRRGTNQIVSQRTGFAFSMEDSQPANIASSVVMPITAIQRWKRKARDNVNTRTALGGAAAGTGILAAGAGTGRLATSMRRRSIQSNSTPDGRKQSTSRSGRRAGSSLAAAAKASETRSRSPARTEESNGGGGGGGGRQRRKRRASQTASQRSSHRSARSDWTAKSRRTGRRRSDASETARSSARGKASRLKRASPSLESAAHGGGTSRRGSRVRREVGVAEDRPPKSPTSALTGGGGGRRRSNRVGPR